jgi:acetyl esterase/lipase
MQHRSLLLCLFSLCHLCLFAQKKPIEHSDVHRWKKIEQQRISNDGEWVAWTQSPVTEGDATLHLWNNTSGATVVFPRGSEPRFSEDNKWIFFRIKPSLDSLKALRRKKVKEEDLPKDSLGIYDLTRGSLEKLPRLKNFTVPEKWSGWLFFNIDTEKVTAPPKDTATTKQDSTKSVKPAKAKPGKKPKKEDKDNGFRLIIRHLASGAQDTVAYVKDYTLAKKAGQILIHTTGMGDTLTVTANPKMLENGVFQLDLQRNLIVPQWRGKGKVTQMAFDDKGSQFAFLLDADTTKNRIRPWQLCYRGPKMDTLRVIDPHAAMTKTAPSAWLVSEHSRPIFSESGDKLFFNLAPPPVLPDTTLLPEEIVQVEVWAWSENRIYTQQEAQLEAEKKRGYAVVYHPAKNKCIPLASPEMPELRFQELRNTDLILGFSEEPYAKYISWEGEAHKDLYAIDVNTGDKKMIVKGLRCDPRLSPNGKYIAWWSDPDTAWYAWSARSGTIQKLTDNHTVKFYNEDTDVPDYPGAHGLAAWLADDEAMLVYDKYDVWNIDPAAKRKPKRLTKGREFGLISRYLRLDPEAYWVEPGERLFLHQLLEKNKVEGYGWLDLKQDTVLPWFRANTMLSRAPLKAKNSNNVVFTQENYNIFPDLRIMTLSDGIKPVQASVGLSPDFRQISDANPQQQEYNWGSIEMVEWTSLSGEKLKGLLVKPEGFDPKKKYPMIVNFYEQLSDQLHRHRSPDFHRSQINYTVYASRGYLVFAPDIAYRTGYPGECAYDAVVSGVTALINKGFVDAKRVALQGHSWGGYQSAYIVTRTNMFACAEAGAPVANMTSAYGGIRWESGLSRAFQYEHQQSRIGGSLWEYPMRYLENSPLFSLDKVQTPLLILHNDKDGAVPWYQGIELYSALRRLGKPTWMLNYNDEPHWPVKLQNRVDFQRRMQQFFDHYLQGAPAPKWMERGVPPMEKGILQGFEDGN